MEPRRDPLNAGSELFFEELKHHIEEMESQLEENQLLLLVHRQPGFAIIVHHIHFREANMMVLSGRTEKGVETSVIIHVHSLHLELRIIEKNDNVKKKPIGFTIG